MFARSDQSIMLADAFVFEPDLGWAAVLQGAIDWKWPSSRSQRSTQIGLRLKCYLAWRDGDEEVRDTPKVLEVQS